MNNESSRYMILWFFLGLFLISIYLIFKLLWPFLSIIIMASVVTGIFMPVYRYFSARININYASLITCVFIFLILFVPIAFFVGVLSKEAADLVAVAKNVVKGDQLRTLLENSTFIERINSLLALMNIDGISGDQLIAPVSELGQFVGRFIFEQARDIAKNIFSFVVSFVFMLLIIFYLFKDGEALLKFISDLSPLPNEQDEKLLNKFKDMSVAILLGNGLAALVQGILGGIIFEFYDLGSSIIWGVIMTFLAFLPIVGIGAVLVPCAIFLFLKGQVGIGFFVLIYYLVVSMGMEYLVKPKLVGNRVKMHTLVVFLSIMGGLKLFGILGIIYGPLLMTFFLTLTDIYYQSYQKMVQNSDAKGHY